MLCERRCLVDITIQVLKSCYDAVFRLLLLVITMSLRPSLVNTTNAGTTTTWFTRDLTKSKRLRSEFFFVFVVPLCLIGSYLFAFLHFLMVFFLFFFCVFFGVIVVNLFERDGYIERLLQSNKPSFSWCSSGYASLTRCALVPTVPRYKYRLEGYKWLCCGLIGLCTASSAFFIDYNVDLLSSAKFDTVWWCVCWCCVGIYIEAGCRNIVLCLLVLLDTNIVASFLPLV